MVGEKRSGRPGSSVPVALARSLRKRLTPQETKLWNALRALRPAGFHFRRQVPVGPYIIDFACLRHRLLIEVDGGQHSRDETLERDQMRDARLTELGFRMLRFWNAEIDGNLDGVLETINAYATSHLSRRRILA
jgi:very-short-patch-repair endonuclease